MIIVSLSGMMAACVLVRETDTEWIINYRDKRQPDNIRVRKDGRRFVFESVDEALDWLEEETSAYFDFRHSTSGDDLECNGCRYGE